MDVRRDVWPLARLELGELLRSRWLLFCAALYAALAGIFVLVALRESAILGFTGMGRVLFSFCHALVLLVPLLALTATGSVITQARDSGALELLFSHPFSRTGYYTAVTLVRSAALLVPLLALVAVMALVGRLVFDDVVPWAFLLRTGAVGAALLWAFVGCGLMISALVRHPTRAQTYVLLCYVAGVALLDFALIGLMLQWRLRPEGIFVLAALNPVEAARLALLSGAEPELAVLGPVGFYLSTRIGAAALSLLGVVWPLVVGSLTWAVGLWRFRRGDLV